ncbi:single-stranded DNA-binding protein [Gemelliphila palaticanis]|uniref:Single-stranded DNA-binding protein n=1 Tax=Gemelliphila palaticanis TaxID=81950 RepID=A0ABX2T453_9BACL|nr:single-stranded DNA-binding protein [Gemella palaticanis]MBF0716080.1 single-stranded DNA-binding protein [Gemella palaticanis]NYS48010.1 single-stranded DNA-binding protein [Gemella palaticanis]
MAVVNTVQLLGRPTKELELKSSNNKDYIKFTLACNEFYNGEKITNFFNIVAFDKLAVYILQNLKSKGRILIKGVLRNNNYKDETGRNVISVNIIAQEVDIIDYMYDKDIADKEMSYEQNNEVDYTSEIYMPSDFNDDLGK